ncbi:MAG: glycosyltransferase [Lachnospiraceae bacterium]|nr:glycosyltransferase [Lachnospiraceae bacterium]MDY5743023.1 glycosyltransferase [Lachnospiraceae bacterium]
MESKEKNFVSAVIYVHNAEERIGRFLRSIIEVLEQNFEQSEIICVNDASSDRSADRIKQVSDEARSVSISMVNLSGFHGLELAMNAGVHLTIGDFVFEFDHSFLDFDPAMVMEIYRRSLQGSDIVSASAKRKEKFTSILFYKVFERYSNSSFQMSTESFRILSRRAVNRISSMHKTTPYRKAVYANCGLKTDHLRYTPVAPVPETMARSEKKYRSKLAVDSLILFTEVGYRFAKGMTILMVLLTIFMLFYSLFIYASGNPVAGWTTTILFLSVAFFGLFVVLTIMVKYLQLMIDLVFKRRQYNFDSIEKLTR